MTIIVPIDGLALAGFREGQLRGQPENKGRWVKTPHQISNLFRDTPSQANIHRLFRETDASLDSVRRHGWATYKQSDGTVIAFTPDNSRRYVFSNEDTANNYIDALSQPDVEYNQKWGVDTKAKLQSMYDHFTTRNRQIGHYNGTSYQVDNTGDSYNVVMPDGTKKTFRVLDDIENATDTFHESRGVAITDRDRPRSIVTPERTYTPPPAPAPIVHMGRTITPAPGGGFNVSSLTPGTGDTWARSLDSARERIDRTHAQAQQHYERQTAEFAEIDRAREAAEKYVKPTWDGPYKRERGDNVPFDGKTKINGRDVLIINPKGVTSEQIKKALGREDFTLKQVVALVAPQNKAVVTIDGIQRHQGEDAVSITINHPEYDSDRYVHKDYIYNSLFLKTTLGKKRQAIGVEVVADQVAECDKVGGMKKLKLTAAGRGTGTHELGTDDKFTGYYAWPRMGYDGELDSSGYHPELQARIKKLGATHVSDLMKDEIGTYLWQKHGKDISVEFDLSENSPNRDMLASYYKLKHPNGRHK